MVASVMANIYRDTKKRSQPFRPADFFAREPVPLPGPVDLGAKIRAAVAAAMPRGPKVRRVPK